MEALNFLRFWKPSYGVQKVNRTHTECSKSIVVSVSEHELDEGDDSFIDLDFPLHELNDNGNKELGSKRKIMAVESISKPQRPIDLLKSAPKFQVFTPKRSKSMANTCVTETQRQGSSKHFTRENSLRRTMKAKTGGSFVDDSSKRLPKDLVQKYLNVIKPLYTKISKKNSKISGEFSFSSPAASPATVYSTKEKQGTRSIGGVYYKHLGKSKSSSAAASPINRRDDSLLLQHDGIQGAILHCKRSFNSSRESSWLSRCTSDSSQEKLSNASSTDSSILSRVTSNSSYEKLMDSARTSSVEETDGSSIRKESNGI